MSRQIYLVRHGETEGESSIRYHGCNDVALSDVGRHQVSRLRPRLRLEKFAAVLHSPLSRAVTSMEILVRDLEHPPPAVEVHAGLAEVNFGRIEGMTVEEIQAAMPDWYREWRAGRVEGFPDGETMAGFASRIAGAFDDIVARHPDGDLLIVAHRGVIKRALAHALRMDAAEAGELVIELASLTIVRDGERRELVQLDWVPPVAN